MIKTKTMNIYTICKNNIQQWSCNSKRCTYVFCRDLDREVFYSEVQICVYDQMNRVQEGQYITRDQWIHWDAKSIAQLAAQEVQTLDSESNSSDSTILYDLDSDMASQNNVDTEIVNNTVDIDDLPDIFTN